MKTNNYQKLLQDANLIESRNSLKCLQNLLECVQLLEEDPDLIMNSTKEKKNLKIRILRLGNKLNDDYSLNSESQESEEVEYSKVADEPDKVVEVEESKKLEESEEAEQIVESKEVIKDEEKTEIVNIVYSKLKKKKSITYNEYLSFYLYVNKFTSEEPIAIIREEGEIAYFIGDTHGSYEESLIAITYFEKILEKSPDVKIIFDGDYVDRNLYDLENLTLITAFFLLYPNNVVMLRGNHEDQKINKYYGFYRNIKDYFIIQDRIDEIYGLILEFFTRLPVIHVLTLKSSNNGIKNIITVHGGIPVDLENTSDPVSLEDLESKIKIKVPSYEQFDDYMSALLWSDPKEHIVDYELHEDTGRNYFGESVFKKFMETNKLDLMVRAHEVLEEGYKFFFNKKLVSLFSTSYYKNRKIGNAVIMRLKEKNGSFDSPEFISINESIMNNDIKENF